MNTNGHGMGHLLTRQAVLAQLGISSSTLDRLITKGGAHRRQTGRYRPGETLAAVRSLCCARTGGQAPGTADY